ncbi:hypothetical protein POVWA1_088450 [Plasmodium ovale wallikeri]|uniref:Uncharacterized protein n=1 Tax=Plasmodium ovale wallikeri TaxID=864142 RepID=A0A1A9AQT8_PLAOA|nr:hypothetical protein POVWA1_088450 [Plasmodium ovale wallikeri]
MSYLILYKNKEISDTPTNEPAVTAVFILGDMSISSSSCFNNSAVSELISHESVPTPEPFTSRRRSVL